ncbi:MAG TPA: hypothetical protein VN493_21270 [Thermoanaerobaculia bacterium]|nr:hypothetical protein [Thermoanaerobaculia bacterium]
MKRPFRLAALVLAGLSLLGPGLGPGLSAQETAQETAQEPVSDTIEVEIKLVPFYAVDEDGKPVFDLKQEEIEFRLDGKPVAVDTFDAFAREGSAPAVTEATAATASKAKAPRRHVVLFLDTAFSSPRGFESGREFAFKVLDGLPAEDLLYLVTHDFNSGLKQRIGPLAATPAGKSKVRTELAKLKPDVGKITAETEFSTTMTSRGSSTKRNVPSGQNMMIDEPLRTTQQAQMEGTARSLADSIQILADQFQRIHEPKLMVFLSQGIDPTLYWMGSDQKLSGMTETNTVVKGENYTGIHKLYEKPLQTLADTGTMSLYVNLDDQANRQRVADGSMQHMARASGGLYLGGVDPSQVSDRFARSTAAYYEAGFYLTSDSQKASRGKLEVVINRPGVRTWSAGAIKTRETWRGLTDEARRLLIVDLIEGEARARKPVKLSLENLPGNVQGGRTPSGTTRLQFQAGWPQELAGRKVDLYNVLLEPTRRAGAPNVLRFDRKEGTRVDGTGALEMELPGKANYVWGIVAIEPATGRAWFRRFQLKGQ